MKRRLLIAASVLVGLLISGLLVAASIWPVINAVETGKTREYPEVQPQYYSTEPLRVFQESEGAIKATEGWTLVEADEADKTLRATTITPVVNFQQTITVRVEPVTEFVTRVHVRSASKSGKGDFGQNARNIETFFEELDNRLGAVKFDPLKRQKEEEKAAAEADES